MSKFKIGDIVVDRYSIGTPKALTIKAHYLTFGSGNYWTLSDNVTYFEGNLVLEQVFNSPLYKALT